MSSEQEHIAVEEWLRAYEEEKDRADDAEEQLAEAEQERDLAMKRCIDLEIAFKAEKERAEQAEQRIKELEMICKAANDLKAERLLIKQEYVKALEKVADATRKFCFEDDIPISYLEEALTKLDEVKK